VRYMLDTNIVSELIRNPGGPAGQRARAAGDTVCVSIIVAAELRYGCAKKVSPRLLQKVDQFLSEVAVLPLTCQLMLVTAVSEPNSRPPAWQSDRMTC